MSNQELTLDDLNRLYVLLYNDHDDGSTNLAVPEMSDRQFREWIVAKAQKNGIQLLPTFGRLSLETRLALVNRLIRKGVRIYVAPRLPHQA